MGNLVDGVGEKLKAFSVLQEQLVVFHGCARKARRGAALGCAKALDEIEFGDAHRGWRLESAEVVRHWARQGGRPADRVGEGSERGLIPRCQCGAGERSSCAGEVTSTNLAARPAAPRSGERVGPRCGAGASTAGAERCGRVRGGV